MTRDEWKKLTDEVQKQYDMAKQMAEIGIEAMKKANNTLKLLIKMKEEGLEK